MSLFDDIDFGEDGFQRAYSPPLERPVSVRVVPEVVRLSKEAMRRYGIAVGSASALYHPNIVGIFELGFRGTAAWVVSEEFGPSLEEFLNPPLESRSLNALDRERLVGQVLCALDYAHRQGAVHRALCPANIRLCDGHQAKVWGWGFDWIEKAQSLTLEGPPPPFWFYLAPEQARGEMADSLTDIYCLGALLYRLWTGQCPYQGDTLASLPLQQASGAEIDFSLLPKPMRQAVEGCLRFTPEDRFQSVAEVARYLPFAVDMPNHEAADGHRKRAAECLENGSLELAELAFREACVVAPYDIEARNDLGAVLLELGRHEEAIQELERAREGAPADGVPHFNLGLAFLADGELDRALRYSRLATTFWPQFGPAHLLLAKVLGQLGQRHEAIQEAKIALNRNPSSRAAHELLSDLFADEGNAQMAARHRASSQELEPEDPFKPMLLCRLPRVRE